MADFLDEKRREIQARLDELRPLVDEYARLEAAAAALGDLAAPASASAPPPAPPAQAPAAAPTRRARKSAAAKPAPAPAPAEKRKRGRPKGSGVRAKQALRIVADNPGIAIPAIAEKMGMKQNYLYRVLPGLEQDGLVQRDGRGWRATS